MSVTRSRMCGHVVGARATVSATNSMKAKGKSAPRGWFWTRKEARTRHDYRRGAKATPKTPLLARRNAGKKSPHRFLFFFPPKACVCDLWPRRETGFTTNSAAAAPNKSLFSFAFVRRVLAARASESGAYVRANINASNF